MMKKIDSERKQSFFIELTIPGEQEHRFWKREFNQTLTPRLYNLSRNSGNKGSNKKKETESGEV